MARSLVPNHTMSMSPAFFTSRKSRSFCSIVHGKDTGKSFAASASEWSHVSGGYALPVAETPIPSSSGAITPSLTSSTGLIPGQDPEVRQMPVRIHEEGQVEGRQSFQFCRCQA